MYEILVNFVCSLQVAMEAVEVVVLVVVAAAAMDADRKTRPQDARPVSGLYPNMAI